MGISFTFIDGDAKLEMRLSGTKLTVRRPNKKSKILDLLAREILNENLSGAAEAKKSKKFLSQGSSLRIALGEERCG